MNDTTNRQQQQQQQQPEETTPPSTVNAAGGVDTSQASTTSSAAAAISCSNPSQIPANEEEEEQVVTSTSNESCGGTTPYPYAAQTNQLQDFITSPARITSSTGNDYSSSPIQQHNTIQGREESANLLLSTSEDDSSEHHQQVQQQQQQQPQPQQQLQNQIQQKEQQQQQQQQQITLSQQEEELNALDAAMPTTSAAAAAAKSANLSKSKNLEKTDETSAHNNHLTSSTRRTETCDRPNVGSFRKSTETKATESESNMVARDSGNNLPGSGSTTSADVDTVNHVEKIILKLPKQNESQNVQYKTRHQLQQQQQQQKQEQQQQEHFLDNDPSMSNSCSNSSTNSSITAEADTRKVEPLKINLHHGNQQQQQQQQQQHLQFHHHGQQHQSPRSPSSSGSSTADAAPPHVIPKITIKPLFPPKSSSCATAASASATEANASSSDTKAAEILASKQSETSASNAPIPKLTIKAAAAASENMSSEPHIVPKLTIRAAHDEEGGCMHTSIVPKLTIKISDTQMHGVLSPPNAAVGKLANSATDSSQQQQQQQQPPLPKLTIKTTLDGASGSSILSSSISPASTSNSNSSSSTASSPQSTMGTSSSSATTAATAAGAATTLSKMGLKSMQSKSKEDLPPSVLLPAVPKLTIKTSPSGSCVASAATTDTTSIVADALTEADGFTTTSSSMHKIPKLTIKTGQEHAVIITTQHKNEQTIPKLTIKTKSLEIEDDHPSSSESNKEPEKIPKITIKSASTDSVPPPIPKLTISTPHSPKSHSSSSSSGGSNAASLVVRQVVANNPASPTSISKTQSPDRVPKLMISRQELTTAAVNHGITTTDNINEKVVPKLTIKTTSSSSSSSITGADHQHHHHQHHHHHHIDEHRETSAKIPKLTIKTLPSTNSKEELQSSEDSDDGTSIESAQSSSENLQSEQQQQQPQPNKTVPKLTITNLGSPTLRLKTVASTDKQLSNETPSIGHKKSMKVSSVSQTQANNNESIQSKSIEKSLSTTPNVVANGGESSSSQEFCGFTENTTDSAMAETQAAVQAENSKKVVSANSTNKPPPTLPPPPPPTPMLEEVSDTRRPSDDMDIDEGLQAHDPKIFKNITHFGAIRNGEAYGIHMDNNLEALPEKNHSIVSKNVSEEVVDTVDLTSSPSPGSSPAHFNYTDADPKLPEFLNSTTQSNALLLECLQRETSVIQTASRIATSIDHNRPQQQLMMTSSAKEQSNSLLLSQLTAPLRYPTLPPLHPRPQPPPPPPMLPHPVHHHHHLFNVAPNALSYPQLNERLIANGAHAHAAAAAAAAAMQQHAAQFTASSLAARSSIMSNLSNSLPMHNSTKPPTTTTTVIDSIEILDTPEGSPRSSQDDSQSVGEFPNRLYMGQAMGNATEESMLHHNNNIMHHMSASAEATNHSPAGLKRSAKELCNYTNDCLAFSPNKMRRTENMTPTMATLTILTNDNATNSSTIITTSPTLIGGASDNHCAQSPKPQSSQSQSQSGTNSHHRSRKQKHDNILDVPMDEIDQVNQIGKNAALLLNSSQQNVAQAVNDPEASTPGQPAPAPALTPAPRKRGRPRRIRPEEQAANQGTTIITTAAANTPNVSTPTTTPTPAIPTAERRVQLLRKRLAIDMVSAEQPVTPSDVIDAPSTPSTPNAKIEEGKIRRERAIRTTRRCGTPNSSLLNTTEKQNQSATPYSTQPKQRKQRFVNSILTSSPPATTTTTTNISGSCEVVAGGSTVNSFNHFGGSNSSLSSACSSNSSFSTTTTLTTTATTTATTAGHFTGTVNSNFSAVSSQIDLTMSSSSSSSASSSACSGATTSTLTTVAAGSSKSMLPPIKALSSTDPLPDVVFQSQDFSAIMLTQQLNSVQLSPSSRNSSRANSQEGDDLSGSIGSGDSGDDSSSQTSPLRTPGRGRGRGRGRGSRGGPRGHRLGRGASAVAKAIALNRPRCVGGLKHTPDPARMKGIITPSPQMFEEDTRMSADMSQIQTIPDPQTPIRQPDFLSTNEEESQSSIISNNSILDPNNVAAVQNGANVKRLIKKKKMEVCAAEDIEYTVSSIAEYDWPPPKGCCPSKNRDTFMIQEQVANYLGIKSFKRKYPDLPRRQIDMEERNWLQEKGLVTEKMCDLGITAVWASDILDIMHADFFDKYEEYKDFVRRKHIREIETKQKSLGINVGGRGLQARDRAMLSASKWNAYFNKTRKDERSQCLDLQNLMVNVPLPADVPATTIMTRSIVDEISSAASAECIAEPPTLLKSQDLFRPIETADYYPVAVVPGQYVGTFKSYNQFELCALPVNTVLDNPMKKENAMTSTADETDTTSETCDTRNNESSSKRLKIRRSRRARSERSSKLNCDSKSEKSCPLSRQSGSIAESVSDDLVDSAAESFCESSSGSSSCSLSSSDSSSSSSTCTSSEDEMDSDSAAMATCAVCHGPQNKNPKNFPELFINCYTCDRKVHPSCIEMPYRMVLRVRNYNWQCVDCKCCIKCKRKQEPNKMLYCEQCDRGFHIYCLGVKSVPDCRWSCERCSVCIRCGATKPEGLTQQLQPNGEKIKQIKHKKVKWINEYRIDNITKLREHCSMLCVPCGRSRTSAKRLQNSCGNFSPNNNQGNSSRNSSISPGFCSGTTQQQQTQQQQQQQHSSQTKSQLSPDSIASKNSDNPINSITSMNSNAVETTTTTTTTSSSSPPPPPVVA